MQSLLLVATVSVIGRCQNQKTSSPSSLKHQSKATNPAFSVFISFYRFINPPNF